MLELKKFSEQGLEPNEKLCPQCHQKASRRAEGERKKGEMEGGKGRGRDCPEGSHVKPAWLRLLGVLHLAAVMPGGCGRRAEATPVIPAFHLEGFNWKRDVTRV